MGFDRVFCCVLVVYGCGLHLKKDCCGLVVYCCVLDVFGCVSLPFGFAKRVDLGTGVSRHTVVFLSGCVWPICVRCVWFVLGGVFTSSSFC